MGTNRQLEQERKLIAKHIYEIHGVAVDLRGYSTRQLKDIDRMLDQAYAHHKLNAEKIVK